MPPARKVDGESFEVEFGGADRKAKPRSGNGTAAPLSQYSGGPVDLDELFEEDALDDDDNFFDDDGRDVDHGRDGRYIDKVWEESATPKFFNNPNNKRLLDNDASL